MGEGTRRRRLDMAMVDRGLAESRARAQSIIMGGGVTVDGMITTKPSTPISPGARLELVTQPLPYVSRGGIKLRHALDSFGIDVAGAVAVDVGASTGGFTDVLLQAGAQHVYAIDVGYGQLAWSLRNDDRVTVMERTNIRGVASLPQAADLAVIDVSFISLLKVLPTVWTLLRNEGAVIALVKPQFEAGREQVGKKGVVRDPRVWEDVLTGVTLAAETGGWTVRGLARSPIRGPAGNVEFLTYLSKPSGGGLTDRRAIIGDLTCGEGQDVAAPGPDSAADS